MLLQQPHGSTSLYVGDLSPEVTESHLYDIFNAIGPVSSVRICRECGTSRSLGYAYVNYHLPSDAERSLDTLNYTLIKGLPCRIMWSQRDPTLRRTGTGNVYVKNLDEVIDNKALHDTFSLFGNILSCKVATDQYGKSKGFGFVHFDSNEAAKKAIEKLNNVVIGSKVITVCHFLKQNDRLTQFNQSYTNLYVKQFPDTWSEDLIREIFSAYGPIASMIVSKDSKNRRFALINYEVSEDAHRAVESLHGRKVDPNGLCPLEVADTTTASGDQQQQTPEVELKKKPSFPSVPEESSMKKEPLRNEDELVITSEPEEDGKVTTTTDKKVNQETSGFPKADQRDNEKTKSPTNVDDSKSTTKSTEQQQKKPFLLGFNEVPEDCLYVQRAMGKAERIIRLKESYLAAKASNLKAKNTGTSIFIKNIHESVSDEKLKETFAEFGEIISAKITRTDTGVSRGFAFISYTRPEDATRAVAEMNSVNYFGKPLYVSLALSRLHRNAQLQQRYRAKNPQFYRTGGNSTGTTGMLGQQGPTTQQLSPPMVPTYPLQAVPNETTIPTQNQVYGHRPMTYAAVPWHPRFDAATAAALSPNPAANAYPYTAAPTNMPPQRAMMRTGASQNVRGGVPSGAGGPNALLARAQNQYVTSPTPPMQQINHTAASHHQNFKFTAQARNRHEGYMQPPQAPSTVTSNSQAAAQQQQAMLFSEMLSLSAQQQQQQQQPPLASAATHPQMQKQIIGERLFPLVHKLQPELAGKITGMMLEMDNVELLNLLDSEPLLQNKVEEALTVLHRHQSSTSANQPQQQSR